MARRPGAAGGAANETPIIVKKVVKGGGGHHGGSWKVAYADFTTAMMAFFLLLWLLNVATDDQKRGIADYFAPVSASMTTSGAGGVLGGQTMVTDGSRISDSGVPSVALALAPPAPEASDQNPEDDLEGGEMSEEELAKALAEREERMLQEAKKALEEAIANTPALAELSNHLLIDITPEGLRIQLVDRDQESMFPIGSAKMYPYTRKLLHEIAKVIADLPNKISISGHTDASPYRGGREYTNWELSTDRANASRRVLLDAGLDPNRIARVVGMADKELLLPDDPFNPINRRISIILLRGTEATATLDPTKID